MKSPFKFLDAYTARDRDQFWGREEEISQLYGMVAQNRLILVYGQSGTGKTSLIQCGLAGRFDSTDWLPIFIRRQDDLNRSFQARLEQLLGENLAESPANTLQTLYETFLRPPYLIFDQLEELFILGSLQEQQTFASSIKAILETNTPCRILFVIREEYLAQLYGMERSLPALFDRRLRVEPMSASKVKLVLESSFERFNIQAEDPATATLDYIIDNLSGGKSWIQLPYLQVYLDTLYQQEFALQHGEGENTSEENWLPLNFTRASLERLGKIENVLDRFLRDQQEKIQLRIIQSFGVNTPSDAVRKVLDAFVSDEGTKRPIAYDLDGESLHIDKNAAIFFEPLQQSMVLQICRALEQARLLRFEEKHMELAHDALAHLIDNQRTVEQRGVRETLSRLQGSYREYLVSGEMLSRGQLNSLEAWTPMVYPVLQKEVVDFIEKSRDHATALEQAALETERRKKKQARKAAAIGFSLAIIAILGLLLALQQYRDAARNAANAYRNMAVAYKIEGKFSDALSTLQQLKPYYSVLSAAERDSIDLLQQNWKTVAELVEKGQNLNKQEEYLQAATCFNEAYRIAPDAKLKSLVEQAQKDLEVAYRQSMLNGETQMLAHRFELAETSFNKALKLKPGDTAATRKLLELKH